MKNKKILFGIIFLLFIIIVILGELFLSTHQKLRDNATIYCKMESSSKEKKMEVYFDFKEEQVYRYSIVNTNRFTENINIEAYEEMILNYNHKYRGVTGKFWTDNHIYMTTEIYDLDLLSEEEFKEITGMSLKELKTKTRQQIINSIVLMGNGGSFKCH